MAGLNHCSGEYVVIMDDDLQHSPYDIPLLVEQCKTGFDICYANFARKRQKWWKNVGSWLNGKLAEILINKPTRLYLSPFQALRQEVVQEIIKYSGPYPYVQGLILRVTSNYTQIDIKHHARHAGTGNFNFVRSVTVFIKLATTFSVVPLRVASIVGSVSAVLGFLMIPYHLYVYLITNEIVEGWTSLMIILLVIGGLILLSLGMLGEYVGRMYLNINESPQFVVKQVLKDTKEEG
jgi:undecaprenyl-phosphate 4-deoxy-4-formamido-L-arabinose transferase